jgi:Brp/Blh family beta-carotene 15,15'-monooxygenase
VGRFRDVAKPAVGMLCRSLASVSFSIRRGGAVWFLTSEPTATLYTDLLHKITIAAIIASAVCLAFNVQRAPWVTVEYALLVATGLVTPPLIYFVIYFCALPSPRHFLLTADQLDLTLLQGLSAAWPILVATLAITAPLLAVFTPAFEPATLQIVFIGLAALTVSHMILSALIRSAHK